jgi:phosphatidylglycerophosphatase A
MSAAIPPKNMKTDPAASSEASSSTATQRKPRFAIFIATAAGLGYFPKAPGTFGSLAGILLMFVPIWSTLFIDVHLNSNRWRSVDVVFASQLVLTFLIAAAGVWSANRAADFWRIKDPQRIVIDEVSGQHLTLILGCGIPIWWKAPPLLYGASASTVGLGALYSPLNWKYLLLGFILFRLFDIWKPFPARQAESLPGGWGIMADDWIAGLYAAIGLWIARAAGL